MKPRPLWNRHWRIDGAENRLRPEIRACRILHLSNPALWKFRGWWRSGGIFRRARPFLPYIQI
jgi:hypothetical protein